MRKRIWTLSIVLSMVLGVVCVGCSSDNNNNQAERAIVIDLDYDYTKDIEKDIDEIRAKNETMQKELEDVEKVVKRYEKIMSTAKSQIEMNRASRWNYLVWYTELNSILDRIDDEEILEEQKNWLNMQDEVRIISIGPEEENGSLYRQMENDFLSDITRYRVYVLGEKIAKMKEEDDFSLPEKSDNLGLFVDNQGTGDVYSYLYLGESGASISIYRIGILEGVATKRKNEKDAKEVKLDFKSDDGTIKGEITLDKWNGAKFKVKDNSEDAILSVGEEIDFGFMIN